LQMELRGERFQGKHHWVMGIEKHDASKIAPHLFSGSRDLSKTYMNLPAEFRERIARYQGKDGFAIEIKLDQEDFTLIQDRKMDWWDWAVPFVWPALRALHFKDCLRDM